MRKVIEKTPTKKLELVRDDSDETGRYYFHTTYNDDAVLHKNKRMRLESIVPKKKFIPAFGEGEGMECIMAFRAPPDQFALFQVKHPDIYKALTSTNEATRIKAAERMRLLHPEWLVTESNW